MAEQQIFIVNVETPHSRALRRVETAIWKHGSILAEIYTRARDEKGRYTIRRAIYVVLTPDPRRLRITLTQLEKQSPALISF